VAIEFRKKPGIVAYLTAGDPDLAITRDIALAAIDNGADVIELGVPFSDPLADGPVIQRASQRAVARGTRLTEVLGLAQQLRAARPSAGLVLFSYLNPVVRMGMKTFCARAAEAGASNAHFEIADAVSYKERNLDFIAFFDCLHDMADPSGAARHARQTLKADGHCMIVEPMAGNSPQENHNAVGRVYYGASALICVPVSLARNGPALGAQAGEQRLRQVVVEDGGFARFRRAAETPFNIVLEARP